MIQPAARMSWGIAIVTSFVIGLTVACAVSAFSEPGMGFAALGLMLVLVFCYLTTPVGYELDGNRLTVFTHLGSRTFEPVVGCAPAELGALSGVRLFGNGGVFAGTGFYWNRRYGVFRGYVTSSRRQDMLMVQTPTQRVVITPADPLAFLGACACAPPPGAPASTSA
jgi:hypothetical protein